MTGQAQDKIIQNGTAKSFRLGPGGAALFHNLVNREQLVKSLKELSPDMLGFDQRFFYWDVYGAHFWCKLANDTGYPLAKQARTCLENVLPLLTNELKKLGDQFNVIDLGVGDGQDAESIISYLIGAFEHSEDHRILYSGVDISRELLFETYLRLKQRSDIFKKINMSLINVDFADLGAHKSIFIHEGITRLFMLLGGTLANFDENVLLRDISSPMKDGDILLIGADCSGTWFGKQGPASIVKCYSQSTNGYLFVLGPANCQLRIGVRGTSGALKRTIDPNEYKPKNIIPVKVQGQSSVNMNVWSVQHWLFDSKERREPIYPLTISHKYTAKRLIDYLQKRSFQVIDCWQSSDFEEPSGITNKHNYTLLLLKYTKSGGKHALTKSQRGHCLKILKQWSKMANDEVLDDGGKGVEQLAFWNRILSANRSGDQQHTDDVRQFFDENKGSTINHVIKGLTKLRANLEKDVG